MKQLEKLTERIRAAVVAKRNRRAYRRLAMAMACAVVFVTTYSLIIPAITLERDKAEALGLFVDGQRAMPASQAAENGTKYGARKAPESRAAEAKNWLREAGESGTEPVKEMNGAETENAGETAASGTESAEEAVDPGTKAAEEAVVPGTEAAEEAVVPGTEAAEEAVVSGTEAAEKAVDSGTESAEGTIESGNAGNTEEPGIEAAEEAVDPGTETAEKAAASGTETAEEEADPGTGNAAEGGEYDPSADLPAADDSKAVRTQTVAVPGEKYFLTVSYGTDAGIPEGAAFLAAPVDDEAYSALALDTVNAAYEEDIAEQLSLVSLFDLSIMQGGQVIEPAGPIDVRIDFGEAIGENQKIYAVHFPETGEQPGQTVPTGTSTSEAEARSAAEVPQTADSLRMPSLKKSARSNSISGTIDQQEQGDAAAAAPELMDTAIEGSSVSFTTGSFSYYAIVSYTVDFHYEINGKTVDFSIPGGGFVSLEHVVEALGIASGDENHENGAENAESDAETSYEEAIRLNDIEVSESTKKFVADVESVEFSSPELVWVGKADTDSTVGGLKEANGLVCEYSVDLTEEQISEINAQTVEAGDWVLIGIQPFMSEESLVVTMKNGDQWIVRVTDAQLHTQYLNDKGDLYEVTVAYDEKAGIPEDAVLKVIPYGEDSDVYRRIHDIVFEQTDPEEMLRLQALDISIVDADGNEIEPASPVRVKLVMKNLPGGPEIDRASLSVKHLDTSSGEIHVETVADTKENGTVHMDEDTAAASFTLGSFSQFAITFASYVQVNVHYVDVNGNELAGSTNTVQITRWDQELQFAAYQNRMSQQGYMYLGTHYGSSGGQIVTRLKATYSPTEGSLVSSGQSITFYNDEAVVARQEYAGSLRQVDVYLVYAPVSQYYIQDTIGVDGCLTVKNGTEVIQTGTEQNLFVKWYRSSNGTSDFQEVTQSKILNGTYNIPELGGPKVNVSIDEGADQYYRAEVYRVENNQETVIAATAVYHVPYYDDVRNGGFETPHNPGGTNESENRWPSNWQVENGQRGVVWKTTGTANDGTNRDIEIPQGAAADGRGANDLGETLRNYCFAFMPEGNQCAELNCEASGALYQDVLTIPGSQIYWSLYHRARGGYDTWKTVRDKTQNKESDTMYVVAMPKELAEKYDVTTQEKVLSILQNVNVAGSEFHDVEIVRITTKNQGNGTVEFLNSGYSMTVPPTYFGNLSNGQTATAYDSGTKLDFTYSNTDWHYYTGNFSIPENQYLTRFFFVAGTTASGNPTMGNFLDDIKLSDSVPAPNYGQATAIIQKTVEGLNTLPENYATRIEATYKVTNFNGTTASTDRDSDYDLYRTQIDESGKAISTASWTFPITIPSGGSAAFTDGNEVSPQKEGKTDEIAGYEQITTWRISKRSSDGVTETAIASGTGKTIPKEELAKLTITERDIVCIAFINSYRKKQPVSIWKTDMNSRTITTGAVFELYKADEFDESTNQPKEGAESVATGKTGTNGILYLGELAQGEYRLLEIKAPDGYILPDGAAKIIVRDGKVTAIQGSSYSDAVTKEHEDWVEGQTEDTNQIQVWNNPGVELPSTGGPGTRIFRILGSIVLAFAGVFLVRRIILKWAEDHENRPE